MGLIYKVFGIFLLIILQFMGFTNTIAVMSVDLGSEWLKVAIVKPGVPMEIALNKQSKRKTPFIVSIKGNERLFGDPAQTVSIKQPRSAYVYLTHLIGKKYDSHATQLYKKRFPFYQLLKDKKRDTVIFQADEGIQYSVEELFAMMLNHTKHMAESFADHPMNDVVLTVPVFFNQAERQAVLNSANMIGINVLQLMNDNTAVALNYGIFRAATFNSTQQHIMFYDMGASHTTVTIVSYSTTKVKDRGYVETIPQLVIKGVGFDSQLGGLEMDMRLRNHFVDAFKANHKTTKDITGDARAMAKLLKEAKRVRQVLSANTDHRAQIESVFEEIDFKLKVTRGELEEMCQDLYKHVKDPIVMALKAAAMTLDDIETVILMGGATRIPKVQEILLETVKKETLAKTINADEAAVLGAVYKAADLTAGFKVKRFLVKDLNLFPIDVQFERTTDGGDVKVINRNLYHRLNPLPQKKIMTFNKKPNDFYFNVSYGDLTFLSDKMRQVAELGMISHVKLSGVDVAHSKHAKATPKGVKAYFSLDESGLLHLEKVEAHFEKSPELIQEEEQSAFAKLGSKLSSFFGSSKSEEETIEEGKSDDDNLKSKTEDKKIVDGYTNEKKTEQETVKDETLKNETRINESISMTNKTTNETEEAKPKEPVVVKEELNFSYHAKDVPSYIKEEFEASKKKLNDLEARDQIKAATERAFNNLESYIYEFKTNLNEEHVQAVSTESERTKLEGIFNSASSWLDDEGFEATEEILKEKLKSLKENANDIQFRLDENAARPLAIASMLQSLNLTSMFFESFKSLPDAKEIYTDKDVKDLEKVVKEGKEWLITNWKKQNESDPTSKPVLLTKDIVNQQGKVDRELMYLVNKAKYYVPKPKPKPKLKSNETEFNATKTKENGTSSKMPTDTSKSTPDDVPSEDQERDKSKFENGSETQGLPELKKNKQDLGSEDSHGKSSEHHEPLDEL